MNEELLNILNKVRCLYMKYGIKSVTMDDVARELGISKKTLYQYVSDKNELVKQIVEMEMNCRKERFINLDNSKYNAIEEIFEVHKIVQQMFKDHNPATIYDLKKYYPELHANLLKVRRENMYKHVLDNLIKGKKEGIFRTDFEEEIIAKLQVSRIEATLDEEFFTQEELLSPKIFYEIFVYHIRGIANEKGLKILEEQINKKNINFK